MSGGSRREAVLDAAYQCLLRHGARKTTMEDIARVAGMSRPAVYQYVRNREDAFRRVAARGYAAALVEAEAEALGDGTLAQRLDRVLAVRLHLTSTQLPDLLEITQDLAEAFANRITDLLTATITEAAEDADLALGVDNAREFACIALALVGGLDGDPEPQRARERLRNGIALLVAGLAATAPPGGVTRRPADADADQDHAIA
jgi:TetR/AcrR family transcriptional regulator